MQCITLPSYPGALFLLFSGPQRSPEITQPGAREQHALFRGAKDLEPLHFVEN